MLIHEVTGHWDEISSPTPKVERRVAANLATPCVFNVRSLLSCALVATVLGDDAASSRLKSVAESLGMTGFLALDVLRLTPRPGSG